MPAEQLREPAADGLVNREPAGKAPVPVEYSLTEYGRSALPIVESMPLFGRRHIERRATID
ncbi:winged helix-turn-helix transcriptional regulator [Nonomuraea sp. CA-143628]|uniref:winged helix-turn-helix transcriptional regulator n=1 Tax=Nonomuraea sp. CA-143628 TaxID=3239997 RepID=UPI003D91F896